MSLPPALLQRLAQRGLVQKQKGTVESIPPTTSVENEEVIAEDYDEMEADEQAEYPSQYDYDDGRKRIEENFWLERMKARMGDASSSAGYKGCPNKYNIWHKCTLYCVNRWADGKTEPSREYMRRFKRLMRKYPLPKGWSEIYDPGCGCYYFYSVTDNLVSWLPPTHPKSQLTKSAASIRRQMEEASGEGGSDGEQERDEDNDQEETNDARHEREIDDIINSSIRPRSPPPMITAQDFPSLQEAVISGAANAPVQRKQKSRDLNRALSRQRRDRDRDRDRDRERRRHGHDESDVVDPMDPSSYSDAPRGKWSDGLQTGSSDDYKKSSTTADGSGRDRKKRHDQSDDDDDEHDYR